MKTLLPATLLLFAAIAPAAAAEAIGAGHEYDNIRLDAAPHSDASELAAALRVDPARTVRSYDAAMFGLSQRERLQSSSENAYRVGLERLLRSQQTRSAVQ